MNEQERLSNLKFLDEMDTGLVKIGSYVHRSWMMMAVENGKFDLANRLLDHYGVPSLSDLKERIAYYQLTKGD